ncbi:hypothetical protein ACXIVK_27895 [Paraburkholderia caledonica]|jgi:hypothetical protein
MTIETTFFPTTSTVSDPDGYKKLFSLSDAEFVKLLNVGHPSGTASLLQSTMPDSTQKSPRISRDKP